MVKQREICSDWYGPYTAEDQVVPAGPLSGKKIVVRGGSFDEDYKAAKVTARNSILPEYTDGQTGFRIVMVNGEVYPKPENE
ncbi:MAG: hypothetical protein ACOYXB_08180 [Bacteroidota bacterium]